MGEVLQALYGRVRGVEVPRHYGDPGAEYQAAHEGLAMRDRSHRARLLVLGRAPIAALQGVLTGSMPGAPVVFREGIVRGRAEYSAVLTPKGRMIARELWRPIGLPTKSMFGSVANATGGAISSSPLTANAMASAMLACNVS